MISVQSQLSRWLALVMTVLSAFVGAGLTLWIRGAVLREFDRSIFSSAHALQALVTRKSDGSLDVDVEMAALSSFTGKSATEYFCFEDVAGRRIAASSGHKTLAAPAGSAGTAWNATLPNGIPARAVLIEYSPVRSGEAEEAGPFAVRSSTGEVPAQPIRLVVARDRRPLEAMLFRTTLAVGSASVGLTAAAVIASSLIVRRGLRSLHVLASDVGRVDVRAGHSALSATHRPAELHPIIETLNGLLERVDEALQRERQFTAAASHELRTPIAELRLAADVALQQTGNYALLRRAAVQARDISTQMQTLVTTLLSLASVEQAAEPIRLEPVDVRTILGQALERRTDEFALRRIGLDEEVADELIVRAHPTLLLAVFDNLLGNAAVYAPEETRLRIRGKDGDGVVQLWLENAAPELTADDVNNAFAAFWRKDAARSRAEHIGMGLTLVKTYCAAMNIDVRAELSSSKQFRITLTASPQC